MPDDVSVRRRLRSGSAWVGLCALALAGCAPRQAVVETDPRGGQEVRQRLGEAARADLEALKTAQEDYRAREGTYSYDLAVLGVVPSAGVRIDVLEATAGGFAALAQAGSIECGVFVGSAAPPRAYTRTAGVVACRS